MDVPIFLFFPFLFTIFSTVLQAKTLTVDNGREFYGRKDIANKADVDVCFADPYASWQRGSNENANGLLRRHFPKGINFNNVSAQALKRVVEKINSMPRKLHNWKSACEVHYGLGDTLITWTQPVKKLPVIPGARHDVDRGKPFVGPTRFL